MCVCVDRRVLLFLLLSLFLTQVTWGNKANFIRTLQSCILQILSTWQLASNSGEQEGGKENERGRVKENETGSSPQCTWAAVGQCQVGELWWAEWTRILGHLSFGSYWSLPKSFKGILRLLCTPQNILPFATFTAESRWRRTLRSPCLITQLVVALWCMTEGHLLKSDLHAVWTNPFWYQLRLVTLFVYLYDGHID